MKSVLRVYGAGEERRRSIGLIKWKIKKYYILRRKGASYIQ